MLFTVYDPKGEMFEVTPARARDCIVNLGWSPSPPKPKELPLFEQAASEEEEVQPKNRKKKPE
jgi:hypothetical protein